MELRIFTEPQQGATYDQLLRIARAASLPGDVMIVGGAQVYAAALPLATEQVISEVPLSPEGDVLYPAYDAAEWVEAGREVFEGYERVRLVRAVGPA